MRRAMVVAAGLAVLVLAGCGGAADRSDRSDGSDRLEAARVSVARVAVRVQPRAQWLPGTVHPADQAEVAAKLMATVAEAEFAIGQRVRAGELLVVLEAEEITAQVEQARAALAQVARNLERERGLLAQAATTAEAVRTLEDQLRLARARLAEAETLSGYREIRAPFDGIITSKPVRRGVLAIPGMPLLTIEGMGAMRVHVEVPDSLSAYPPGEPLRVEADGRLLGAVLSEWSPAADPASRTRLAKLDLPEGAPVRSGQYVRVRWPAGEVTALWAPAAAISRMGQMERVFTVQDGRLRLRLVRTGARDGEWVQVLSGLHEGEQVVLHPGAGLRDGQPAQVQP